MLDIFLFWWPNSAIICSFDVDIEPSLFPFNSFFFCQQSSYIRCTRSNRRDLAMWFSNVNCIRKHLVTSLGKRAQNLLNNNSRKFDNPLNWLDAGSVTNVSSVRERNEILSYPSCHTTLFQRPSNAHNVHITLDERLKIVVCRLENDLPTLQWQWIDNAKLQM